MTSAADKIRKLKALMNNPAATAGERAAAKAKIAAFKAKIAALENSDRRMSVTELADTIARLKQELNAIPGGEAKPMAGSDTQRGRRFSLAVHDFYNRDLDD